MKQLFILFIVVVLVQIVTSCKSVINSSRLAIYDELVTEVLAEPLPNFEIGKTGKVKTNGIEIWYEFLSTTQEKPKGTVVLIEGLTATAIRWGSFFYEPLLIEGFNVLRFDNRDVGKSTWIKEADYSLSDMANDLGGLLDELNMDSIHLVGQSMGGMIAQEFVLNYPDKVKTLTLIYTSGDINDKQLPEISAYFVKVATEAYFKFGSDKLEDKIKAELAIVDAGNGSFLDRKDLKFVAQCIRFEEEKRNGQNKMAAENQENAINKSGSRYDRLYQINTPTLIIHGEDDQLINIEHGKKLARFIPQSKTVWVEKHGHNTSISFSKIITRHLLELIETTK